GEPAAPRRQSLLRSQARYALLPAATPRLMGLRQAIRPDSPLEFEPVTLARNEKADSHPGVSRLRARIARTRGVAAGRSAQRACERSSDWRRGAAGSPDPSALYYTNVGRRLAGW